ncbi:MAG: hypothetical protein AAFO77_06195, partial [Pseudomonadota bacterium]
SAFCALTQALNGRAISVDDYGYDGEKGIGRFTHDGQVWFMVLSNDGGGLKAEFTHTTLALDTLLGVNPNAATAAQPGSAFAYEDLFPASGHGHAQVFLQDRMPVPGRPNVFVPSGDLLLSEGSPDRPSARGSGRAVGGERLYSLDFGQCPQGVSEQLCRSVAGNINRSFALKDYAFNGEMSTAQVTFGSRRYLMTLEPEDDMSAIRMGMHLVANPQTDVFASFVVGVEGKEQDDENNDSGEVAFQDACTARMDVSNMVRISQPESQHGQRLAFCTAQGQCADDTEGEMTTSLCEITRWSYVRERKTNYQDFVVWDVGCAVRGSSGPSTQLEVSGQQRLRWSDGLGVYYGLHAQMYQNPAMLPTDAGYHSNCSDCDMVETLYCAPDGPAVFGQ